MKVRTVTLKTKEHYDALAAWAESYTPTLDPANPPLRGEDAAAAARVRPQNNRDSALSMPRIAS